MKEAKAVTERERTIADIEYYCKNPEIAPLHYYGDATARVPKQLMFDTIALLKAQEPMEPVLDIDTWKCGNCGHALEHQQLLGDNVLLHEQYDYCPECGRAVKWE